MPTKRVFQVSDRTWYVTPVVNLLSCPLKYDLSHIRKIGTAESVPKILGTVVHAFFDKFFAKKSNGKPKCYYKSRDSFTSAVLGFWTGIVKGDHGPRSFSRKISPPLILDFSKVKDPGIYYGMIHKICGRFWDFNNELRDVCPPHSEMKVRFQWCGMDFGAIIDRLHDVDDGHYLIDYKPGWFSDVADQFDLQFTMYQLSYKLKYGKDPLKLMVYNYTEYDKLPYQEIRLRSEPDFVRLTNLTAECSEYLTAVATGVVPDRLKLSDFEHFNPRDIATGRMSAREPIGGLHCRWCEYFTTCKDTFGGKNLPSTREYLHRNFEIATKVDNVLPLNFPGIENEFRSKEVSRRLITPWFGKGEQLSFDILEPIKGEKKCRKKSRGIGQNGES